MPVPKLVSVSSLAEGGCDGVIFIGTREALLSAHQELSTIVAQHANVDATVLTTASCIVADGVCGRRLITGPTGPLDRDYDDVRRVHDAVVASVKRARAAGCVRPLLVLSASVQGGGSPAFANALCVGLAAALAALYVPLTVRKAQGPACEPVQVVHFLWLGSGGEGAVTAAAAAAYAVEVGKRVCRDVGGADPEAGAPAQCASYLEEHVSRLPGVTMSVTDDPGAVRVAYPLAAAVARASLHVPRHHPRVVRLEYDPGGDGGGAPPRHVILVGKGITYDTGGADVKTGGHMAGMSRDKCGAAAVAGFVAAAATLGANVRITALLGFVRNSVGSDAYVSDEIITARSGARVLVVNTDAEGRMVMADLLCEAREIAAALPPAQRASARIHTVATLTGHAVIACGPAYSIAVDNGPARAAGVSAALSASGGAAADPFEISTLRREDYAFVAPATPEYDVKQVNNAPSVSTPRGHQFPAAFMILAAGLDKHGVDSEAPLAYTHIDCAGSSVAPPFLDGVTTGSVVAALTHLYALNAS